MTKRTPYTGETSCLRCGGSTEHTARSRSRNPQVDCADCGTSWWFCTSCDQMAEISTGVPYIPLSKVVRAILGSVPVRRCTFCRSVVDSGWRNIATVPMRPENNKEGRWFDNPDWPYLHEAPRPRLFGRRGDLPR